MTGSLVIRRTEVDGRRVDLRCEAGVVTHVGSAPGADEVIDAAGGATLPGLHDHHIHLLALAAARSSVAVGPPDVTDRAAFDSTMQGAARAPAASGAWIRAVGYHEAVAGPLDRHRLDALVGDRPVRVQHRTGAMWVMNSVALRLSGFDQMIHEGVERHRTGEPTGRLFGLDRELRDRVGAALPDLGAVGAELAAYGVTGVTDLTPTEQRDELDVLAAAVLAPGFPLAVVVTGGPDLPRSAGRGLRRGPVKFVVADHRLASIDELTRGFRRARQTGRNVAVHCVSRVALVVALAAWDEAGVEPGDRIEHGAVIPAELLEPLARLGLVVVTQPSFVAERGDEYLTEVDPEDLPHLWRCGSLLETGISVAAGSDAPYGNPDPWASVAAAVNRTTRSGAVVGPDERIDAARALRMFLSEPLDPAGPARRVVVGGRADLCVLDRPLHEALASPLDMSVAATVRAGRLTHNAC